MRRILALVVPIVVLLGSCPADSFDEGAPGGPEKSPEETVEGPAGDLQSDRVEVPRFIGKRLAAARRLAKQHDLRLARVGSRESSMPVGTVLSQTPVPGALRRPGALVRVTVAKSKPKPPDGQDGCTPGYSPCLPPASDYDCAGGTGDGPKYTGPVKVTGSDPYDLDGDSDGQGCE
jgi:hypothetical protein